LNLGALTLLAATSLALSAAAAHGAASSDASFKEGVAACRSGQYEKAIGEFQDSLAKQPAAGTLLNLGIAEWQSDRVGDAILSWEQALWLDPFDQAAHNNLHYARQAEEIDPPELRWYEVASTWLPANTWAWLAGGSLWLAVAMVTLPGILRIRKAGWHQALAAFSLGVLLFSIPPQFGIITRSRLGIMLEKDVPLRLTPTQEAEAVASLNPGDPARELRDRGNYIFIRTQQGSGWVERNQIGFVCPAKK
jgi:tetratricopeptide (TPR) repeat protein